MAFIKRTWLARLGTGLNKFLIGDKGADGKQTLTNSPDTVVQEGDVISADNLNDLEDRIYDEFGNVSDDITAMKLTKVWENPNPNTDMADGTIANLSESADEIVIEYKVNRYADETFFKWVKIPVNASVRNTVMMQHIGIQGSDNIMELYTRIGEWGVNNNQIIFRICSAALYSNSAWHFSTTGYNLIPVAIYKVGDIYNS